MPSGHKVVPDYLIIVYVLQLSVKLSQNKDNLFNLMCPLPDMFSGLFVAAQSRVYHTGPFVLCECLKVKTFQRSLIFLLSNSEILHLQQDLLHQT